MQAHVAGCDALLEVHDARVPLSGRNRQFDLFAHKPRLLLLNKADLADRAKAKVLLTCGPGCPPPLSLS